MSRAGSQERTLLGILASLRGRWRRDPALSLQIERLLRSDRRMGSRDRRLYRELVYTCMRYLPWVEPMLDADPHEACRRLAWLAAPTREVAPFREAIAQDLPPCPAGADAKALVLGTRAADLDPAWLAGECPEACQPRIRDLLLTRSPLWVRLQSGRDEVMAEFRGLGWDPLPSAFSPDGLRLPTDADVARTRAFAQGLIEVQDIGSQRVLLSGDVRQGQHWLDACAGAGGKTLQLAALVGPAGRVTARDPRPEALGALEERARRAGLDPRIGIGDNHDPHGGYDGVLVDAPCTGSGTWRRSPHLRWTTGARNIEAAAHVQISIAIEAAALLRPGGVLVYATCSLCRTENEAVAEAIAGRGLQPVRPPERLAPDAHDGDGFFVAAFRRP